MIALGNDKTLNSKRTFDKKVDWNINKNIDNIGIENDIESLEIDYGITINNSNDKLLQEESVNNNKTI